MQEIPWQVIRLVGMVVLLGPPVGYYVYRDSKRRGEDRPIVRAVGYGVLGIAGLFLYLYQRGDFDPSSRGE